MKNALPSNLSSFSREEGRRGRQRDMKHRVMNAITTALEGSVALLFSFHWIINL